MKMIHTLEKNAAQALMIMILRLAHLRQYVIRQVEIGITRPVAA